MTLSETTRKILRLVEERSGIPVHVEPDSSLPGSMLARVVMARGSKTIHEVFYRPDTVERPDYLICQQAGFILRFFGAPPDQRFDFAASADVDEKVEGLVKAHPVAQSLPPQAMPRYCEILRDGLLNHLRSTPVGLRVDHWLAQEYPALADLQREGTNRQLQAAVATLAPQHGQTVPTKIYDASQAISAAHAAFWAARWNQPQLSLAFKTTGHLAAGQELLSIWESTPDEPENDHTIIDRWAEKLGVAGWHQWVPYDAPR